MELVLFRDKGSYCLTQQLTCLIKLEMLYVWSIVNVWVDDYLNTDL